MQLLYCLLDADSQSSLDQPKVKGLQVPNTVRHGHARHASDQSSTVTPSHARQLSADADVAHSYR